MKGGTSMEIIIARRDEECEANGCCTAGSCPSHID